mmetsp:Transcript_7666/g.11156  ORF Transcript_7666/g.11156 Transcript_7666/m.11156 type:complete len:936 (-) Transcript_7666:149-2956(-)
MHPKKMTKREKRLSQRQSKKNTKKKAENDAAASMVEIPLNDPEAATTVKEAFSLQDISCTIPAGSLVAVVGEVGCGKSSFLSAILGEMEAINGSKVYIPQPSIDEDLENFCSYCTQTPWVVNDTFKDNILFGRKYDEDRYQKIISACALNDDLKILPAGDMTEIGERGINLSGGQKARVCLARALYSVDTQLLLLDDPLSAVDAHVGEHLFGEAIAGKLAKNLTRVLVTHHVHFLPRCDFVIVLDEGRIKHMGTYKDLVGRGVDFAGAVDVSGGTGEEVNTTIDDEPTDNIEVDTKSFRSVDQKSFRSVDDKSFRSVEQKAEAAEQASAKKKGENLITEEEREEGNVGGDIFIRYGRAGGLLAFIGILLGQSVSKGFEIGSSFWLSHWVGTTVYAELAGDPLTRGETSFYVGIYGVFGLAAVIGLVIRAMLMAVHRLHASRKLHKDLTASILRAPISFFDVTPTGRILNRFAFDMDKMDLELMNTLSQALSTSFSVLGSFGAITAATKGVFLVPFIPLAWFYYVVQKWFRKTSTELQRVTSMTGSPIFADFSQTLSGTSTIRAYSKQTRFFTNVQSSFDKNNASYVLVQFANLWLGLRLDLIGGFVGSFIGALAVATHSFNFIPAGWLGLALTYAIEVTGFLKHGVRMIATIEADMSSVERILFYAEKVEPEAADFVPEKDPKEGTWPTKGEIKISNASMRYRDGPLVLKNLCLTVKGGERVGVVGRTGSGKSSLMAVLFRISELEKNGGKIVIDGVDTSNIGTNCLRSNLSIIPQDPTLFSNTVRYNIDPTGEKTDEQIWDALKKVKLEDVIGNMGGKLEELVAEGGENFSQGQRQLLCIARSLLRNPKILVMDEATASIDNTTDAAIQEMIRDNFSSATVLVIAHRLNTIMDSDRVLVLDQGEIAEFDTPKALLRNKNGIFSGMIEKSLHNEE